MPAERVSTTAEVATIIRGMRSAADASGSWSENRRQMNRKGLGTAVLVFFAVVIVVGAIAFSAAESLLAWDVRFAYLPAAEAVLDGQSPYPALDDPILEDQKGTCIRRSSSCYWFPSRGYPSPPSRCSPRSSWSPSLA